MANNRIQLLTGFILIMLVMAPGCASDGLSKVTASEFAWSNWGAGREDMQLSREDAIARYNYCPTGGCVVRLESVEVKPSRAFKGETLTLATTYTILTPEQLAIPISISREVFFQGKSLGRTKDYDARNFNGTWTQRADFPLPANAAPGIYSIVTRVNTAYGSDQKTLEFSVQ